MAEFKVMLKNNTTYHLVAESSDAARRQLRHMGMEYAWFETLDGMFRVPMQPVLHHGGCVGCLVQGMEGPGGCVGCCFHDADWSLPEKRRIRS